ncbi:MFS transporter [Burkholderia multivorans]|uniref:MFS transporter n=1 Tax=Burkholderia multivorans TaxID=87883 RepID=UPI000CFE3803|nr:MFS transporter [Burkholderia multivorans]MBY4793261.1 MFS transporter [Burkholderia multivorans]PRE69941.1 MFS transporter [Burkholderia multivorans]PRE85664.1 MFS transporter [Burkholderia multivorans]PRG22223.1 MFS transporter [Burkholderia multivorans]HEF4769149.1 MFS transporter [Burkholderia multivorans]
MKPSSDSHPPLTRGMTLLFACACGIVIGNIYYAQPLLAAIAHSFGRASAELGYLVTLTQIGYAASLLLIVPLGDALNRHTLIVRLLALNVVALVGVALSTQFAMFVAANVALGFVTCSTQLLVPFAASLADARTRGRAVGTVMSGLLLGILLARVAAGAIADWFGWRAVYAIAAVMVLALTAVLAVKLPKDRRDARLDYPALMKSLAALVRAQPLIALRSAYGALVFACFSLLWTGLTFLLSQPPYGYSEGRIGLFGIVGAVGALAATSAGRLVDRGHGNAATGLFAAAVLASFAPIAAGAHSLAALIAGILLLDVGVQGMHISNQSVIYALAGDARSRVTTIYLTSYFVGGALGSFAASVAYGLDGWRGVCAAGGVLGGVLVAVWLASQRVGAREVAQ